MCGIVGTLNLRDAPPPNEHTLRKMLATVRHRGPDEFGIYLDNQIGLGSARLSIIDLSGGQQPIANEDESLWIVFNGEIFNYIELRPELETSGHRFRTRSDTEVLLHLYEEYGPACLQKLNGQFATAIWDNRLKSLFLGRDRLGIRPLFYAQSREKLVFGSEIKAILAEGNIPAGVDPAGIAQVFTYWSVQSPRSAFAGIQEVPPGHFLRIQGGKAALKRYWHLDFPPAEEVSTPARAEDYLPEFRELLIDSVKIRLRADVPVGAYLSGGLDSSVTAAIIRNYTGNKLDTFSIAFEDEQFDESGYQMQMARFLGTDHQVVRASYANIREVFPKVVWHTETPLTRAGPAPLFLLSKLVRENHYKVVMTGEGADEFLAGYNIFKEAKIRRFWARQPESALRPALLTRLYPYIGDLNSAGGAYLKAFFRTGLEETSNPFYSHQIRWRNTSRIQRLLSAGFQAALSEQVESQTPLTLPEEFSGWHPLSQAQYLEAVTFLSPYLLSSQGDRMAMANSVEGRYPFLDHRVIAFCSHLPPHLKLNGLAEKYLLKQLGREWLPSEIWQRPKTPYRAPIQRSFIGGERQTYVQEILSPEALADYGLFEPRAVARLLRKAEHGNRFSETDEMALLGVLSTQLWYRQFIRNFETPEPIGKNDKIRLINLQD